MCGRTLSQSGRPDKIAVTRFTARLNYSGRPRRRRTEGSAVQESLIVPDHGEAVGVIPFLSFQAGRSAVACRAVAPAAAGRRREESLITLGLREAVRAFPSLSFRAEPRVVEESLIIPDPVKLCARNETNTAGHSRRNRRNSLQRNGAIALQSDFVFEENNSA
jgi:hypothetical protein